MRAPGPAAAGSTAAAGAAEAAEVVGVVEAAEVVAVAVAAAAVVGASDPVREPVDRWVPGPVPSAP